MERSLKERIVSSLSSPVAYVSRDAALEALTAAQARRRPSKKLTTVWEQLAHVVFWQESVLETLRGGSPAAPETAAGGWPPMPGSRGADKEWEALKGRFRASLAELQLIARNGDLGAPVGADGESTLVEELLTLEEHNAYHFGQIVFLRRLIDAWPPPSGGHTW